MIPDVRIQYKGARVRLRGATFAAAQNLEILGAGLESIKARLSRGIGSDDAAAAPLSKSYARAKKNRGAQPIRDMRLTGALLDQEIKPRYADQAMAIADAGTRFGRLKARVNRDSLLFSPNDQAAMEEKAAELFRGEIVPAVIKDFRAAGPSQFGRSTAFQRSGEFS